MLGRPLVILDGLGFTEGPLSLPDGRLVVTSLTHGSLYVLDLDGRRVAAAVELGCGPTGLALHSPGRVVVAHSSGLWGAPAHAPAGLSTVDLEEGSSELLLSDGCGAPNDLAFAPDGRLLYTDPVSDRGLTEPIAGSVCAYQRDGSTVVLDGERLFPNGIAVDADRGRILVAESFAQRLVAYPLGGGEASTVHEFDGQPDGMALDEHGNVYVCLPDRDRLAVLDAGGAQVFSLSFDDGSMPTNCCFDASDGPRLFVTVSGRGAVAACPTEARGLPLHRAA
jgi:gluconolactonase